MKRHIYVCPESGSLEDYTSRPYSWDSSFCVVLRDNEDLWQSYLAAERACDEARRAVLDATTEEPLTAEEQVLHDRADDLHMSAGPDIDAGEWLRRNEVIEEEARKLAERQDEEPLRTKIHRYLALADQVFQVAASDASAETKYDLVFSEDLSRAMAKIFILDFYDPDTTYEEDLVAYVSALRNKCHDLRKVLASLVAKESP